MVTGEESSVLLSGRRSSNSSMGAATTAATASGVLAAAAAGASAAVAVNTVIPTLDILPSAASRTVQVHYLHLFYSNLNHWRKNGKEASRICVHKHKRTTIKTHIFLIAQLNKFLCQIECMKTYFHICATN